MLGYLNAPSPFTADGWLDTGDLVEVDGEYIRFLGRHSELINVGGEKVFPAEVENVILELDNVAEALVYGERNPITGNIVCATVRLMSPEQHREFAERLKCYVAGRLLALQGAGQGTRGRPLTLHRKVQEGQVCGMIRSLIRNYLSDETFESLRQLRQRWFQIRKSMQPVLSEDEFRRILKEELLVESGQTLFVHSSIDRLNLGFPFYRVIALLRELVGEKGNLLFPTDSAITSRDFLEGRKVFDQLRTPSVTGLLTEFARRQTGACRSLHPSKSVCALGPAAMQLTGDQHRSPYPYGENSPYYRIVPYDGRIIGLGVSTRNLSFVHCVEDRLKEAFPVRVRLERTFTVECQNNTGQMIPVTTFSHDPILMDHDIPRFMQRYVQPEICRDIKLKGYHFFRAEAGPLLNRMSELARQGITIYPRNK